MAKEARENVWLQCKECNDLNYRTNIRVVGQDAHTKLELKKFCPRDRKHTEHKVKRK